MTLSTLDKKDIDQLIQSSIGKIEVLTAENDRMKSRIFDNDVKILINQQFVDSMQRLFSNTNNSDSIAHTITYRISGSAIQVVHAIIDMVNDEDTDFIRVHKSDTRDVSFVIRRAVKTVKGVPAHTRVIEVEVIE